MIDLAGIDQFFCLSAAQPKNHPTCFHQARSRQSLGSRVGRRTSSHSHCRGRSDKADHKDELFLCAFELILQEGKIRRGSAAGTTTSASMIADPALICRIRRDLLKRLVQSSPRRVKTFTASL